MTDKVKNILFISLSCVGDAVMTTPVIESLHQSFPDARFDIVGDSRSSALFRNCPYLGDILNKDKSKFLRGGPALLKVLWHSSYDLIVDVRTDGFAYLLRGRKRYTKWGANTYGKHCVEELMGVVRKSHGDNAIPPTHIWLDPESERYAKDVLSALPGGSWLAFAPGVGGAETKLWPAHKYAELADSLKDLFSGVILDGGPNEKHFTEAVAKRLTLPYVDMAGKTDLLQAAALIKRASMFVGSDSGMGHVASAVSTPTLSFFSNDEPERCLPWGNKAVWLKGELQDARNISVKEAELKIRQCLLNSA